MLLVSYPDYLNLRPPGKLGDVEAQSTTAERNESLCQTTHLKAHNFTHVLSRKKAQQQLIPGVKAGAWSWRKRNPSLSGNRERNSSKPLGSPNPPSSEES